MSSKRTPGSRSYDLVDIWHAADSDLNFFHPPSHAPHTAR